MTTATAKKRAVNLADETQRRLDAEWSRLQAFEEMKSGVVDGLEEIEPSIMYSIPEWKLRVFAAYGFEGRDKVLNELRRHHRILEARAEVGDPAVLQTAEAALRDALEAERTARAEAGDLESTSADDEPALAQQIRQLQARLRKLQGEREAAQERMHHVRSQRKWLRDNAPKGLAADVQRRLAGAKASSPTRARLVELKSSIPYLENIVASWENHERAYAGRIVGQSKDPVLARHAEIYAPESYNAGGGSPSVDAAPFTAHVAHLREEVLPKLTAQRHELLEEWQATVDEIEAPLTRWVETGELFD